MCGAELRAYVFDWYRDKLVFCAMAIFGHHLKFNTAVCDIHDADTLHDEFFARPAWIPNEMYTIELVLVRA